MPESKVAGASRRPDSGALRVSALLKRGVVDAGGEAVGRLSDVIVRLQPDADPVVSGLVVDVHGRRLFVPASAIRSWRAHRLELASAKVDVRPFERRGGEVLIREDILGHRLIDLEHARLVRAVDAELTEPVGAGWRLTGVDVHQGTRLRPWRRHAAHAARDWAQFELLLGRASHRRPRGPRAWLGTLRPAEIADLLEEATGDERTAILSEVHDDPELEADVYEELDEGEQSEVLAERTDEEVAAVLARMQADDAADAVMELLPERRATVLEQLPPEQRSRVTQLLGYHEQSAGGLMGVDVLECPIGATVAEALDAIRAATAVPWHALTSVYCTDGDRRLCGAVTIVRLLQADSATPLAEIVDADPVQVMPDADVVELAVLMSDHNLLALPVVDSNARIVGLITADDILDATVPQNWRRRGQPARAAHRDHPSASRGSDDAGA